MVAPLFIAEVKAKIIISVMNVQLSSCWFTHQCKCVKTCSQCNAVTMWQLLLTVTDPQGITTNCAVPLGLTDVLVCFSSLFWFYSSWLLSYGSVSPQGICFHPETVLTRSYSQLVSRHLVIFSCWTFKSGSKASTQNNCQILITIM